MVTNPDAWPVSFFAVVASFCGLGAVVDFLVGKKNENKIRDYLVELWVRLDDLKAKIFDKQEMIYTRDIIVTLFGERLFSRKRVAAILYLTSGCLVLTFIVPILLAVVRSLYKTGINISMPLLLMESGGREAYDVAFAAASSAVLFQVILLLLLPSFLISLIKFSIFIFPSSTRIGIVLSFIFLIVQILFLSFTPLILHAFLGMSYFLVYSLWVGGIPGFLDDSMFLMGRLFFYFLEENNINVISDIGQYISMSVEVFDVWEVSHNILFVSPNNFIHISGAVFNYIRIMIFLVFVLSIFFAPGKKLISLLLLRLEESGKPIFVLIFGVLGAISKLIVDVWKWLA